MDNNNSTVFLIGCGIMTAILVTVAVNLSTSEYSGGSNFTKQETYLKLQQRPSKLIQ